MTKQTTIVVTGSLRVNNLQVSGCKTETENSIIKHMQQALSFINQIFLYKYYKYEKVSHFPPSGH